MSTSSDHLRKVNIVKAFMEIGVDPRGTGNSDFSGFISDYSRFNRYLDNSGRYGAEVDKNTVDSLKRTATTKIFPS